MERHIGRPIHEMLPMLSEKMARPIAEVFEQARGVSNLEATVRVNGDVAQDFLIAFYPYEEDGRVAAVGVILKDVTELRRLENESGAPGVGQGEMKEGFGMRLIKSAVMHDLQGSCDYAVLPDGVSCTLVVPL
jgi:hypothetical protein